MVVSKQTMDTDTEFGNVVFPWIRATNIPRGDRAAMLLNVSKAINLKSLVWILRIYGGVVERSVAEKIPKQLMWDEVVKAKDPSLEKGFFHARSNEVMNRGFAILAGLGDIFSVPPKVPRPVI